MNPHDPLLAIAWRAWLVEAASLAETPVDCLDMAREIREGAAHGLTLGEGDGHLPRPRPTPEGVGRFLHTVELESLRTRNARLREKAGALLHIVEGREGGDYYYEMLALREELDRYDDEIETNSEVES